MSSFGDGVEPREETADTTCICPGLLLLFIALMSALGQGVWVGAVESRRGHRAVPLPSAPVEVCGSSFKPLLYSGDETPVIILPCVFLRLLSDGTRGSPFRHHAALSIITLTTAALLSVCGSSFLDISYKWKQTLCVLCGWLLSLGAAFFFFFFLKLLSVLFNLSSNLSQMFTAMSRMGCLEESQLSWSVITWGNWSWVFQNRWMPQMSSMPVSLEMRMQKG